MGWVSIEALNVAYGERRVLDDVSLRIPRGSLVAVLGPSGCGKTTLLRAVAGLLPVTSGTITVGGRLVTGPGVQRAPEKRGMGWVPQDASLFPHLSVGENIGFGLPRTRQSDDLYCEPGETAGGLFAGVTRRRRAARSRLTAPLPASPRAGARRDESGTTGTDHLTPVPITPDRSRQTSRAARIAELATLVGLAELVDRAPSQLSGGQAQRVSLARALAPRPDLMLLDEPFAALDPLLRAALRTEVAALLRGQHNTSLLVTHDQEEALSLADFVAVMRGGEILQFGTPADVYERPVDPWVAGFVGDTVELNGVWQGGRVDCGLGSLPADWMGAASAPADGTPVLVLLRPEWLTLAAPSTERQTDAVTTAIAYAGHDALVSFTLAGGLVVRARVAAPDLPRLGDRLTLGVRQNALAYPVA
ncbi:MULTISPECIES: ABC transporter ATP-binding protein [Cryobacterium]|uniref:ABC transporter ATP-binding protein n=1 Tax=Cryobacterium TaxID=69578 RepID=UPI0008D1B31E|nr:MULTISPECIES: ABC transporter ATP-binding protein [Cryobacterium]SEN62767.1 TOBE domain-containing protein [Cryobacterium luteum]